MSERGLKGLAVDGRLRAAINLGNAALARRDGRGLAGVSPALARRLAATIGVALEPVVYEGAGKVFADADADAWDVAFLAIDATRARRVCFTRPYHGIEATYAVRATSAFRQVDEADRDGQVLLVAAGSAYDLHLGAALSAADLVRAASPGASFQRFRAGEGDLVAGVRQSLEREFGSDPDYRILPGRITAIEQAMVLPGPDHPCLPALDAFLKEAIEEGFIAEEIARTSPSRVSRAGR